MLKNLITTLVFLLCSVGYVSSSYMSATEYLTEVGKSDISGDWSGTLDRGWFSSDLRLVFRITESADGYTGTLYSLDQGGLILIGETILDRDSILITLPSVSGEYTATLAGNKMTGFWTQYDKTYPELTLTRIYAAKKEYSAEMKKSEFIGDWSGTLGKDTPGGGLRLVFHIIQSKDGYTSIIDSLDQGGSIPDEKTIFNGDSILISYPIVNGEYKATIEGDKLTGIWTRSGQMAELSLLRMKK